MAKVKYFVVLHDRFLSGWGEAEGKRSLYVLECSNMADVKTVQANARTRDEMSLVAVVSAPNYWTAYDIAARFPKDHVDVASRWNAARWYEPGAFNKD